MPIRPSEESRGGEEGGKCGDRGEDLSCSQRPLGEFPVDIAGRGSLVLLSKSSEDYLLVFLIASSTLHEKISQSGQSFLSLGFSR